MKHTMHLLHFVLSVIFFPCLIIWVWRASSNAKYNREQLYKVQKEQVELLKLINNAVQE